MIDILRQSPNCRKRVTSDASIQLQYVAKTLESDDIIDKKIIDLNPGTNSYMPTILFALILYTCIYIDYII